MTNVAWLRRLHVRTATNVLRERVLRERTSMFFASAHTRHTRDVLHREQSSSTLRDTIVCGLLTRLDRRVIRESRSTHVTVTAPAPRSSASTMMRRAGARRVHVERTSVEHSNEVRTSSLRIDTQFRRSWLQTIDRHTRIAAQFVTRATQRSKTTFERSEELVWHRTARPASDGSIAERHAERREPLQTSTAAPHAPAPAIERMAAPQVTKLDSTVMDRIADDVIRRVERRIRIERERRGL